jgi:hypothetical protein
MDHHCIFYSKCIGKGNIYYFWITLALLVVNFIIIGFTVVAHGHIEEMFA